ncbi:hypothetical protein ES332_D10G113000v1 [Gossypium tomentosum]|uniref:HAT C-terminal dimerisation domain-containing protein n=1 Tax=Gossypium tomentosum TaxID=34277 RepID=A0A5D2J2B6_GOSTO|nr:hypothetical protein ES332_D10G113000v1 [Gossypium tomentosum]
MSQIEVPSSLFAPLNSDACPSKIPRVEDESLDLSNLEREPGLCKQIYEYLVNMRDEIRRAYIKVVPYQPIFLEYTASNSKKHPHPNSLHNNAQRAYVDLMNQTQHIEVSFNRQTTHQIATNCLRLKTSVDVVRWLSFKGYTSSTIQKKILQTYANRVRNVIREEIGDRKFNIIMDNDFFYIVHVKDTASLTLKNEIFNVLLQHSFDIQNIQGQGYDGASNLALVVAAREVVEVHQFFKDFTLQHPGETRWSSHLNSITSLLKIFKYSKFIFILHMMNEVLGVTDNLCQALQSCSQDELDFSNMNAQYIVSCSRNKKEDVTVKHHYRVNILFATIDTQLQELKSKFNEHVVELLILTTISDPNEFFKLFDIDKIYILVNKFYQKDFSQQEKERLPYRLKHYELDVCKHLDLRKISTLSELCKSLVESGKLVMYPLVDRLIRLLLTLLVSTAFSEHAFSTMKIVKTRLSSKMEDDFLSSLVVYIEKEIVEKIDVNKIINDFSEVKDRKVQFK